MAIARLRSAMLACITEDAMRAILDALIKQALAGNVAAIREILDRTLGKPVQPVEIDHAEERTIALIEMTQSQIDKLQEFNVSTRLAIEVERRQAGSKLPPPCA